MIVSTLKLNTSDMDIVEHDCVNVGIGRSNTHLDC